MHVLVVDDSATIRRVVRQTLEQAGYETAEALDGRDALDRVQQRAPDLILVDDVMPHMDGPAFVQAMRSVHNLRHIPVVMMSARAEHVGEALLRETGAVDAIKKPFGPEALLAVTAHALERGQRAIVDPDITPVHPRSAGPWSSDDQEEEPTTLAAEAERAVASRRIAGRLAIALGDVVRDVGTSIVDDETIGAAIVETLGADRLLRLVEELRGQLPGEAGVRSFSGRLDHVSLGEVLQMLQHQRQSGILEARREGRVVAICLREGLLDLAMGHGNAREFLLGRYLLRDEMVDPEDLQRLLERRGGERRLLGAQLVKLGYITQEDLNRVLVRQSSELIYEALRWPDGEFGFERFATRPEATAARLGLPIASILMEGLRRVDEWRLVEEQLRSFDVVPVVRHDVLATISTDTLEGVERAVLDSIDGERTVRDIVAATRMNSFDVGKVLFQLITSGLVHERH